MNKTLENIQKLREIDAAEDRSDSETSRTDGDEPKNPQHIDRIEAARTDEQVETYNARKEIRKSVGRMGVWMVYAGGFGVIAVSAIYLGSLGLSPWWDSAAKVTANFEPLFDKIVQTMPWVLLFIFGDAKKLAKAIGNDD
jgi:hypothetical protein